ncbi:MAG TPA: peptide ABC transporter substrate-binding protein [Verrucomicrobiae bacterium]|nr:peptide ABC transporter substrate-binding protein [Verrucomicrobiae bacterium]
MTFQLGKSFRRWIPSLLSFIILFSCQRSSGHGDGQTFRVNLGTEPPSLDWSLATDHVSFNVIANLMVGLTEFDKNLKPAPVIAKSWDVLDGGKKLVFHLREDVAWSDGKKVVAGDFEYSWKRLLNPKTASEYAYSLFDIVNAEEFHQGKIDESDVGVQAVDDTTLEVRLKHPAPYFLALSTFEITYPQRRDVIEKYGTKWTDPENIVTNGPFLLTLWKHENEIQLKANPHFFLGKPAIEKVEMLMVTEMTTALAMYEQGQIDFLDKDSIPILEKPRLSKLPGFQYVPQLRGEYYGFAVDRKPFNDPRVRKAFAMAIDRSVFPKLLRGGEIPATSWIPPGMLAHNPKIGLVYNPPEARRLLREAGFPEGKGFPQVTLTYNTRDNNKIVAEAVQGMWQRNLGVLVRLENQEWKVYLNRLLTDPSPVFRAGWGADYPDPDNFVKLFASYSPQNYGRWKNSRYDQILEQAGRELDERKRVRLYDEAQRILCEQDVPIVPLFAVTESTLLNPRYTGVEYNSMGRMLLSHVQLKPGGGEK